jgi:hypothetical protein
MNDQLLTKSKKIAIQEERKSFQKCIQQAMGPEYLTMNSTLSPVIMSLSPADA